MTASRAAAQPARLPARWLGAGVAAVAIAATAGLALGPVPVDPVGAVIAVLNLIPGVHLPSGLSATDTAIVTQLRLPRVCLGLLVGAVLAVSGGTYQAVFRNPLADPYLLGVAAGAGLGATIAIAAQGSMGGSSASRPAGTPLAIPLAAFLGALLAVALTYSLGAAGGRHRTPATLILAGVAVTSFLTAAQSVVLQHYLNTLREVYAWIMGGLNTAGWHDVVLLLPYAAASISVILVLRRAVDVLGVGDEEAASLGAHPGRIRLTLVLAASFGTAAAVSVTGLIAFVGLVVPHTVRLLAGYSYRVILPLSVLFGGAFLTLADLAARTVLAPSEIPIGVVTAFVGAPFFVVVLRTSRRMG